MSTVASAKTCFRTPSYTDALMHIEQQESINLCKIIVAKKYVHTIALKSVWTSVLKRCNRGVRGWHTRSWSLCIYVDVMVWSCWSEKAYEISNHLVRGFPFSHHWRFDSCESRSSMTLLVLYPAKWAARSHYVSWQQWLMPIDARSHYAMVIYGLFASPKADMARLAIQVLLETGANCVSLGVNNEMNPVAAGGKMMIHYIYILNLFNEV